MEEKKKYSKWKTGQDKVGEDIISIKIYKVRGP
jgi:hypothetical protein